MNDIYLDLQPALTVSVRCSMPSVANLREPKQAKARRVREQRELADLHTTAALRTRTPEIELPLVVVLSRVSPRPLDSDNLASALKAHRDGVTKALARYLKQTARSAPTDDSDRLTWLYAQEQCRGGDEHLRVELYPSGAVALWMLRHLPTTPSPLERWVRAHASALDALLVSELPR